MEILARDLTAGARVRRSGGGIWTVIRTFVEDNGEVAIIVKHERTGDQDVFWVWGHRPVEAA